MSQHSKKPHKIKCICPFCIPRKGRKHTPEELLKMSVASRGRANWSKGKTRADDPRIKGGPASTLEKEELRRQNISRTMKERGLGGYQPNSGRSRKEWYDSPIAGRVFLQSSYEVRYAKILDIRGVLWEKNWQSFPYVFEGKDCRYIPDFRLIETDEFIEVKGFETTRDLAKWLAFSKKLTIIKEKDLIALEILNR